MPEVLSLLFVPGARSVHRKEITRTFYVGTYYLIYVVMVMNCINFSVLFMCVFNCLVTAGDRVTKERGLQVRYKFADKFVN